MKKILVIALFPILAQAGISVKADTQLPVAVQKVISYRIESQCPMTQDMLLKVQEVSTSVTVQHPIVEMFSYNYVYNTTFNVVNGVGQVIGQIQVESALNEVTPDSAGLPVTGILKATAGLCD